MKVRFLADADLNYAITAGLLRQEPSIDFLNDNAALCSLPDLAVLALASKQNRMLVSHDVNTMPAHFSRFIQSGGRSPGLILIPQSLEVARAIDELVTFWSASEASEWEGQIIWLPL